MNYSDWEIIEMKLRAIKQNENTLTDYLCEAMYLLEHWKEGYETARPELLEWHKKHKTGDEIRGKQK